MAKTVLTLPRTSLTMDEGRVLAWYVKEGQAVRQGDSLCELETDKATVEVEAPITGYIRRILGREGEALPVGEPLAVLTDTPDEPLDEDEAGAGAGAGVAGETGGMPEAGGTGAAARAGGTGMEAAQALAPEPAPVAALAPDAAAGPRVRASPAARRLARARGVDLSRVRGSGPAGRVLRRDVEAALAGAPAAPAAAAAAALPAPPTPVPARGGRRLPLTPMRRAVARNMLAAWQTAPQFSLTRDVDMTAVLNLRRVLAPSFAASRGVRLSPVDFLIQAAARALTAHPDLNATFAEDAVVHHDSVDLGLATATDDGGLLVPVLRGAERLTLVEIAARRAELVERARQGRLTPDAMGGGTFTISNLGPFDVDRFQAIVQPGETAILAVGRIQERPAVRDGQLCVRPLMTLTLTVDHRTADGAAGARFLQDLVARLERDEGWLLF